MRNQYKTQCTEMKTGKWGLLRTAIAKRSHLAGKATFFAVAVLGLGISLNAPAIAASKMAVGGGQAQVRLNFRITIPSLLFLRIGSSDAEVGTPSPAVAQPAGTQMAESPDTILVTHVQNLPTVITITSEQSPGVTTTETIPVEEEGDTAGDAGIRLQGLEDDIREFVSPGAHKGVFRIAGTAKSPATYTMCSP